MWERGKERGGEERGGEGGREREGMKRMRVGSKDKAEMQQAASQINKQDAKTSQPASSQPASHPDSHEYMATGRYGCTTRNAQGSTVHPVQDHTFTRGKKTITKSV